MDLKRPLVVLAAVAALAGCGSSAETGENTDVERNEQECGTAEQAPGMTCENTEQDNEVDQGEDTGEG